MTGRTWWCAILVLGLACSGSPTPTGPGDAGSPLPSSPFVVSNPLESQAMGGQSTEVYVSLPPGAIPEAWYVTIRNPRTGDRATALSVDGGFDPVALAAAGGDTPTFEVHGAGGVLLGSYLKVVPGRTPPIVVRTSLPRSKRDVPLNVRIEVTFSEPMDAASLPGEVTLLQGNLPVPGSVEAVGQDGLRATFTPAAPLAPVTTYRIRIGTGVRDRDGDALAAAVEEEFTTGAAGPVDPPDDPALADQLVFASLSDRQIYAVRADGTARRRLTTEGRNEGPAWSPDGRRIAFSRDDGTGADIYVMNENGSNVIRRTAGSALWPAERPHGGLRSAVWSPDGRWLAVSTRGLYDSDIWLIRADDDGTPPLHLVENARSPAWSPDGQRIAFVRISGDDGYDAIGVMNVDGTGTSILTPAQGGRDGLAWSPDGQRLSASVCEAGVCDLFVMSAAGTDTRRVTNTGTASWGGAWSPDGLWIAVTLWGSSSPPTVAKVPAGGGVAQIIATDGYGPSWRP